jgi:hypothetical protein
MKVEQQGSILEVRLSIVPRLASCARRRLKLDGKFRLFQRACFVVETLSLLLSRTCTAVFCSFRENNRPTSITQNKLNLYKAMKEETYPFRALHRLKKYDIVNFKKTFQKEGLYFTLNYLLPLGGSTMYRFQCSHSIMDHNLVVLQLIKYGSMAPEKHRYQEDNLLI